MGLPGAAACSMALLRVLILSMGLTLESLQTLERAAQSAARLKVCVGTTAGVTRTGMAAWRGIPAIRSSASMFDTLSLSD